MNANNSYLHLNLALAGSSTRADAAYGESHPDASTSAAATDPLPPIRP